jgi:hypothetical protein
MEIENVNLDESDAIILPLISKLKKAIYLLDRFSVKHKRFIDVQNISFLE